MSVCDLKGLLCIIRIIFFLKNSYFLNQVNALTRTPNGNAICNSE